MARASESALAELHNAAASVLKEMITPVITTSEEGVETKVLPSAAEVAVAIKFLKDNAVFMAPEQSTAVSELEELVRKRRPSRADLQDAMKTIGKEMLQ